MPLTIIDELLQEEMRRRRKGAMPSFDRTLRDMIAEDAMDREPSPRVDGPAEQEDEKAPARAAPGRRADPLGPGSSPGSVRSLFMESLRSGREIVIPSLDRTTYRFTDSGPRILIELLFTDREFLDMVTVKETVDEVTFVSMHPSIRPDGVSGPSMSSEALLRGLSPLCELILNGSLEMDPTENDWKYLDSVLSLLGEPKVSGRVRDWSLQIGGVRHRVRCEVSMDALSYTYEPPSSP
jgi:hypothetical protein